MADSTHGRDSPSRDEEEEEGNQDQRRNEPRTLELTQTSQNVQENATYHNGLVINMEKMIELPPNLPKDYNYKLTAVGSTVKKLDVHGTTRITMGPSRPKVYKKSMSSSDSPSEEASKPIQVKQAVTRELDITQNPLVEISTTVSAGAGGMALLISIQNYENQEHKRNGAENDSKSLKETFNSFGMRVFSPKYEEAFMTKEIISEWLLEFRSKFVRGEHKYCIVVLMGHGAANDSLLDSFRQEMNVQKEIFALFDNHNFTTMLGLPKIFIMQCCRGSDVVRALIRQDSLGSSSDPQIRPGSTTPTTLAGVSDSLVIWSTVQGSPSYRNVMTGSYFIQNFCGVLKNYAETLNKRGPTKVEEFSELLRELKGIFRTWTVAMAEEYGEILCSQPMQIVDTLFYKFYLKLNGESDYVF